MLIFLVVARYANGYRDERAFSFNRAARAYAAAHGENAEAEILEVPVVGRLDRPHVAYTIRWDDLTPDTENVEAVYGDYHQAKLAVGRHGYVHELPIDLSTDAAAALRALPEAGGATVVDFHQTMVLMRQTRTCKQHAALRRIV